MPAQVKMASDSNIEMSWKVFGGQYADIYSLILKERCVQDGLGTYPETLRQQFRLHLNRGTAYLAGNRNLRSVIDLVFIFD